MADPKTISEAIDSVTEDDIVEDEKDESLLDDETEEEQEEEETEETEEESEEEPAEETEEEEAEEETPAEDASTKQSDDEGPDIFDTLTPEQISEIKKNPALNSLRKSLMRGYSEKTAAHSQLVQLGNAYQKDPVGVLHAIAQSLGMEVKQPGQRQPEQEQQPEADPGKELEALFGEQIGPKVRAVFDKWAEARFGNAISPIQRSLQTVEHERNAARMLAEEAAFKGRHKDISPDVEKEIVALGNSGKIVPGRMTPSEYLDTLYDVVMARRARSSTKTTQRQASATLAKKIAANKRDREPSGISGRGGTVKKVSKVSDAKSISEALDIAMRELEDDR